MPKSVIVASQQHAAFQRLGFSAIHDFSDVSPLFNVRSCLIIRQKGTQPTAEVPMTIWKAKFDQRNPPIAKPRKAMETRSSTFRFTVRSGPASPYYDEFLQGATLVPRCLLFVEHPEGRRMDLDAPCLRTAQSARESAKKPWRAKMEGRAESRFLFATVLAGNLLPFGIREYSVVVLPIHETKRGLVMPDPLAILASGAPHAFDWMEQANAIWEKRRKDSRMSLQARLDYQKLLTRQKVNARWVVLYNRPGTNLAAAIARRMRSSRIGGVPISGFVADTVTYFYYPASLNEAHYLVGVLNSEVVNRAIKPYQTQGLWGERDIARRPFEVCPIPRFDPANPLHRRIAAVAQEAERALKRHLPNIKGPAAHSRGAARDLVKPQLDQLDFLVQQLLSIRSRS
jgi:hypothetical protein